VANEITWGSGSKESKLTCIGGQALQATSQNVPALFQVAVPHVEADELHPVVLIAFELLNHPLKKVFGFLKESSQSNT
jgi:hypothetical protein